MKKLVVLLALTLALVLTFLLFGAGCATAPQQKKSPEVQISVDMEVPFDLLLPERQKEAIGLGYKPGEKVRIFKPKDGGIRIIPKK
jgi:hypothetical protein